MRDRMRDDAEVIRPWTRGHRAAIILLEFLELVAYPVATSASLAPTTCISLEGLPILLSNELVAQFRGINDPSKPVVISGRELLNIGAEVLF